MKVWNALLTVLVLLNVSSVCAGPDILTPTGRIQDTDPGERLVIAADWMILTPPAPHAALVRAANDLQIFLKQKHGLRLKIGDGLKSPGAVVLQLDGLPKGDGFVLRADPAAGQMIVAGSNPRAVYQGVLLLEDLLAEHPSVPRSFEKTVIFPFRDRYVLWDSLLTGQNKGAIGFDLERHVREAVRLGYSGMECNRFVGMTLLQQVDPHDPYPWYTYWGPSMDQFVTSPLFDGVFPKDYLSRNLADLKRVVALVESFGMKPIFTGYEPRYVPEEFFRRHPDLRGPRVDHPLRSIVPRFALCVDRPEVLEHYRVLARRLAEEVPGIREMHVIPQDSGAGICWGHGLYSGMNGPEYCKSIPAGERMKKFFGVIRQGLREGGLEIPLVVQPHKMSRPEIDQFFSSLPREIEFTAGNWASWSIAFHDPLEIDRYVLQRQSVTGRRRLYYQQHFFGFDGAPTSEYPAPYLLAERLKRAKDLGLDVLNTLGGFVSPPVKARSVMQELYRCYLLDPNASVEALVGQVARDLGGSDGAGMLLTSWREIHEALLKNGRNIGFAAGTEYAARRTLIRPLVPDASALLPQERDWWLAYTFGGYLRFGQAHLFRGEAGLPSQEWYRGNVERSARFRDAFQQASARLRAFLRDGPGSGSAHPYVAAHERQLRFLGHVYSTGANLYEGQRILDKYSAKEVDAESSREVDADVARFRAAVEKEIENARALLEFVQEDGDIGMVLLPEETTWAYSRNLPELLRKKIAIMQSHLPEAAEVLCRWFGAEY
jgi:hypothetical protein